MNAHEKALEDKLRSLISGERIFFQRDFVSAYERTTFSTAQRVLGVVKPKSTQEVQAIVQLANKQLLSLYPIGRGCNWGLGSKVPLSDQSLVVDLSLMTEIISFDEKQGYIEIEPGVSFEQISEYLKAHNSSLFLSVTGGHPQSSVIGNTLERGDGLGPLGDRSHQVCSLEVVLGDGTILNTGLKNFSSSLMAPLSSDSLGPGIDGLFFQSNLAIVTRMTIWLKRRAQEFTTGIVTFASTEQLIQALPTIRELQEQGVIQGNCLAIWNIYKILAASGQHPGRDLLGENGRQAAINETNLSEYLPAGLKSVRWLITFALYAPNRARMSVDCALVRKSFHGRVKRIVLITKRRAWIGRLLHKPLSWFSGMDIRRWLDAFYFRSVYLGNTSLLSINSLYWRKQGAIPAHVDPDRDRCGLLWLCHLVPLLPQGLLQANQIVEQVCKEFDFEPNIALLNTSDRYLRLFVALMYDRDIQGEDERALRCQMQMQDTLIRSGFPCFRLGIQSMSSVRPNNNEYRELIVRLKKLFDPKNVLAPGRYDFA